MNVEPQWLQDLSNNFKKLHLNKLWHLLPAKVSPAISTHEQPEQNSTKQPLQQAAQIEPTEPTQSLITTVNVSAPKNEPKTAEPSPTNTNQYDAHQQMNYEAHNQAQYAAADYSYSMNQQAQSNDLSYDVNRLNLNNTDQSYQQYDQSQYQQHQQPYQNDMQSYQQPSDSNLAPAHQQGYNMNADYQNNQYYQPPPDTQQHQTQPVPPQPAPYNPYASTQSRKSSTNSINHIPNESSNLGKTYPSVSMQNIYNPGQRRPSNSSDAQAAQYTRSRNNSSSADNVFAPFNPYQPPPPSSRPQQESQPGYFDPNASANLSKSQTFPSNKTSQIKEEEDDSDDEDKKKPKKKQNYYDDEDEDDLKLGNSKDGKDDPKNRNQPAGANKGWLTGIMSYIKPPNAPKKMVLPDDKKKSVFFFNLKFFLFWGNVKDSLYLNNVKIWILIFSILDR